MLHFPHSSNYSDNWPARRRSDGRQTCLTRPHPYAWKHATGAQLCELSHDRAKARHKICAKESTPRSGTGRSRVPPRRPDRSCWPVDTRNRPCPAGAASLVCEATMPGRARAEHVRSCRSAPHSCSKSGPRAAVSAHGNVGGVGGVTNTCDKARVCPRSMRASLRRIGQSPQVGCPPSLYNWELHDYLLRRDLDVDKSTKRARHG